MNRPANTRGRENSKGTSSWRPFNPVEKCPDEAPSFLRTQHASNNVGDTDNDDRVTSPAHSACSGLPPHMTFESIQSNR